MKFGGTSMAGTERIRRVANIVQKRRCHDMTREIGSVLALIGHIRGQPGHADGVNGTGTRPDRLSVRQANVIQSAQERYTV